MVANFSTPVRALFKEEKIEGIALIVTFDVDKLCEGDHPVEAGSRPEKTVKLFKEAVDRWE